LDPTTAKKLREIKEIFEGNQNRISYEYLVQVYFERNENTEEVLNTLLSYNEVQKRTDSLIPNSTNLPAVIPDEWISPDNSFLPVLYSADHSLTTNKDSNTVPQPISESISEYVDEFPTGPISNSIVNNSYSGKSN